MPIDIANWNNPAANVGEPYYLFAIQPGLIDAEGRSYYYVIRRADAQQATRSGIRDASVARDAVREFAEERDTYVVSWRVDQTGVYVEDVWFPPQLKGEHTKL